MESEIESNRKLVNKNQFVAKPSPGLNALIYCILYKHLT